MSLFQTRWSALWRYTVGGSFKGWWPAFRVNKLRSSGLCLLALLAVLMLAACSDGASNTPGGGSSANTNSVLATPTPAVLSSLHWCSKPAMVFRDQANPNATKTAAQTNLGPANGTPTAINDWNTVKENLGFTIFLPKTLPAGSCLLSVSGSLRDPIFGSNFTITYILPDQNSVSFSQAPSRSATASFQCNVSDTPTAGANGTAKQGTPAAAATPTNNPVQLCNGVRDKTNIVFSARGATPALEQFFQALQPDVNWMPAEQ